MYTVGGLVVRAIEFVVTYFSLASATFLKTGDFGV
jgi:hypothetical protein